MSAQQIRELVRWPLKKCKDMTASEYASLLLRAQKRSRRRRGRQQPTKVEPRPIAIAGQLVAEVRALYPHL